MATDRIISHNRAFHVINASALNTGSLINYSPDVVLKVYKIGFTNNILKSINTNSYLPKVFICKGVGRYEPVIPSDIYNCNSQDLLNGSIVHGAGGMPVGLANPEDTVNADVKSLFRVLYYTSEEPMLNGLQNVSWNKYMIMPQYNIVYEHNNPETQPITLRQNEGIFILNNFYIQANGYQDNYFEFTIE